jgi:hypothetical protein
MHLRRRAHADPHSLLGGTASAATGLNLRTNPAPAVLLESFAEVGGFDSLMVVWRG